MKNALPTAEWLHHRGLGDSPACPWECPGVEDVEHITVKCKVLREVIAKCNSWGLRMPTFQNFECLNSALLNTKRKDSKWAQVYCTAAYHCWRNRNAKKHGKPTGCSASLAAAVLAAFPDNLMFNFSEQWDTVRPPGSSLPLLWCPPPPGWIKINVDGALTDSNVAGLGICIRDEKGRMLKAAGKTWEHWDSTQVELEAIRFIADNIEPEMTEVKGAVIEGDNWSIIDYMKEVGRQPKWRQNPAAAPMVPFTTLFHALIYNHVYRECNKVADFCASFALNCNFIWKDVAVDCPSSFLYLLEEDGYRMLHP